MSEPLLYNVLFAWKCSSTHHKLAMDALRHLRVPQAERWRDLFLTHIETYLEGSKAPDNKFKDFRNHVLHVNENFWGGAVKATQEWYEKTRAALEAKRWKDFVYSAGVLSHYYSDPWQPFHTGQSETEGVVHRAAEWSIACSYDELQQILEADFGGYPDVAIPATNNWLAEMVQEAALTAHEYYQPAIDHYNFDLGKKNPPAGYDQEAKDFLAVLLGSAVIGYARILDRLLTESAVSPPGSNVSLLGFMAQMTVPLFWVTKKMKSAKERAAVEATYKEFQATGKVVQSLSEDDWTLRKEHAAEVLQKPLEALDQEPVQPIGQAYGTGTPARPRTKTTNKTASVPPVAETPTKSDRQGKSTTSDKGPRFYLSGTDPVEAAPSIGPKTAERLLIGGIKTVQDLLSASPVELAKKLQAKHIDAAMIQSWQSQAQLVCSVPDLRGHDAQFLVACGVQDAATLSRQSAEDLLARVTAFVKTPSGERILRDGKAPDLTEVQHWIAQTLSAQLAAAA
ncbi:DUF4332 domain-containing protein [bacterium]|nr:DUF4332 domain-containing protein [bacterium]